MLRKAYPCAAGAWFEVNDDTVGGCAHVFDGEFFDHFGVVHRMHNLCLRRYGNVCAVEKDLDVVLRNIDAHGPNRPDRSVFGHRIRHTAMFDAVVPGLQGVGGCPRLPEFFDGVGVLALNEVGWLHR